jgi:subtilisin family serine protease
MGVFSLDIKSMDNHLRNRILTMDSFLENTSYVEGELLVKFKNNTQKKHLVGVEVGETFEFVPGLERIHLPKGLSVPEGIIRYQNNPNVLYVEPNFEISINKRKPNDLEFEDLWGLENTGQLGGIVGSDIDALLAWEIETGSKEVIIAVIDSGVDYHHPDLKDNLWQDEFGNYGRNFIEPSYDFPHYTLYDPFDDEGHGTAVAGIIAGVGNNNIGITGVLWDGQIMSLKILSGAGTGSISNLVKAIDFANTNGADVINLSLGASVTMIPQTLIDSIKNSNAVIVASAGNDRLNNDDFSHYPSNINSPNLIAVAATNMSDQLTDFSNYGFNTVHVAAPGQEILTTTSMRNMVCFLEHRHLRPLFQAFQVF